jgi:hypothetical protein
MLERVFLLEMTLHEVNAGQAPVLLLNYQTRRFLCVGERRFVIQAGHSQVSLQKNELGMICYDLASTTVVAVSSAIGKATSVVVDWVAFWHSESGRRMTSVVKCAMVMTIRSNGRQVCSGL